MVGEVLDFVEEPQSNGKTIRWYQVRVAPDGSGRPTADAVHASSAVRAASSIGDKSR